MMKLMKHCIFALLLFGFQLPTALAEENSPHRIEGSVPGRSARPDSGRKLRPFFSDGCSSSPDGVPKNTSAWVDCCVEHDVAYWIGGTEEDRKNADLALKSCIAGKGYPVIAKIYYYGVRMGGTPDSYATYRWGYGWTERRDYRALSKAEKKTVERMYGKSFQEVLEELKKTEVIVNPPMFEDVQSAWSNDEIAVYRYLRKILPENDPVISYAPYYLISKKRHYRVTTGSCPEGVEFTFSDDRPRTGGIVLVSVPDSCPLKVLPETELDALFHEEDDNPYDLECSYPGYKDPNDPLSRQVKTLQEIQQRLDLMAD